MDSPDEYVLQPMLVTKVAREGKVGSANNIVFEKASAGAWHSILLTKDGKVFGCGDTRMLDVFANIIVRIWSMVLAISMVTFYLVALYKITTLIQY